MAEAVIDSLARTPAGGTIRFMFDLQLNESETRLMANALDERVRELFEELVHTDDRALRKTLSLRHAELESLAKRVHGLLDGDAAR